MPENFSRARVAVAAHPCCFLWGTLKYEITILKRMPPGLIVKETVGRLGLF